MVDILIKGGIVITLDRERRIIKDGAVAIEEDRIIDVGKREELKGRYKGDLVIDASDMIVIPGLIDCHVHLAQAMLRGCADDLDLIRWLADRIWPLQGNYTPKDGRVSAELCILEMIKSGTTAFVETMIHTRYGFDGIAEVVEESGIRAALSKTVMDRPSYSTAEGVMHEGMVETSESLKEAIRLYNKWDGRAEGRIRVWFGPRTIGGCSPELYEEIAGKAKELGIRVTIHHSEVKENVEYAMREYGMLPTHFMRKVGLIGPNVLFVHSVWVTDEEISIIAKTDTRVCHCPAAVMKCALGFPQISKMLDTGITIGLGCDGGPSNNTYDMIREMRLTAFLQKIHSMDPTALPAEQVLEMATIHGARVLGMEKELGSIEPGKKADVVLIDTKKAHMTPVHNPVSNLVYAACGSDVDTVIIDGRVVMKGRNVLTMDEERILQEARERGMGVVRRAGINVGPRWPLI